MTATKRQSRADRAADQAQTDQQPEPETTSDPEVEETEQSKPEPEPEPELPVAAGDLGAGKITYHWPSLVLPDGTTVECQHRTWGHKEAKAAAACLRKMAAEHGVRVEVPES